MTPLLILSAVLAADPAPAAVAFALEVRGSATVERAGKIVELEEGDPIKDGDKLTVKADAGVTVYFRPSGPVAVLNGPAEARVLPGKLDTTAAVAVRDVKVPARVSDGLNRDMKADLIGGLVARDFKIPAHPAPVRPPAGRAVLTVTPDFAWQADDDAKLYRIELYQLIDKKGRVSERKVWEAETPAPKLAYPSGKQPLARGQKYTWRVTVAAPDGSTERLADAAFVVVDDATAADLASLASLEASTDPTDLFIAAEAYSAAGLTDEPIRLLRAVVEKRPGSALAWAKLAAHYEAAGRINDARKARVESHKLAAKK